MPEEKSVHQMNDEELDHEVRQWLSRHNKDLISGLKSEEVDQLVTAFKAILLTIPEGSEDGIGVNCDHTTRGPVNIRISRTLSFRRWRHPLG